MTDSPRAQMRPLSECGQILSGGTPSKGEASYWGGDIPWFSSKEIRTFELRDSERHVTAIGAENGTKLVPPGTVLFVVRGMSLANEFRVGLTTVAATFNQDVKALIPAADVDGRYLVRCLHWQASRVIGATQQSSHGTKRLPAQVFENIEIPVPPIAEQRRIADILDKADTIRSKRKEIVLLVEELLRSTFLEMFGDPVTNPKGWPEAPMGELLGFLTSGSRGWAKHYSDSGDMFLRIQNVKRDRLDLSDVAYVQAPDSAEARRTLTAPGDVLLSITADLGRTAVIPASIERAFINQHLAILRPHGVGSEFLSAFLASEGGQRQFRKLNKGGTKAGLNFADIRGVRVMLPSDDLQCAFARAKGQIRDLEARLSAAAAQGDWLYHSLVHDSFREAQSRARGSMPDRRGLNGDGR